MPPPALALRPFTDADLPFLHRVYGSTREEELAGVDWAEEAKAAFIRQQFEAQHQWYQEHYAGSTFDVVLLDGEPVGRLYVARWDRELRIVDVALLPERRGQGLGERLVRQVQAEAAAAGKPLTIHVERMNRALSLYGRLGFRLREDKGVYLLLEWRPEGTEAPAPAPSEGS
jgi:GNAT superfamily N-acetyltransferase